MDPSDSWSIYQEGLLKRRKRRDFTLVALPGNFSQHNSSKGNNHHLSTIFVSDQLDRESQYYNSREIIPALSNIGEREGFAVKCLLETPSIWIRDNFLLLSDEFFLIPSSDPRVLDALSDFEAYPVPAGHVYAQGQGRVARRLEIEALKTIGRQTGIRIKESAVYLEGGNVLVTRKADGSRGILIGMSSLLISTFLLNRRGKFATTMNLEAKLNVTKQVIAQELGMSPTQITYLDQLLFHLDMFLIPGPDGKVFIEDPDLSNRIIFRQLQQPNLPENERNALRSKLYADQSLRKRQIALKLTLDELQAAGYEVIGVPGEYQSEGDTDTNFMNGLMMKNKHGKVYYITNQSPISSLNAVFKQVMASYDIDVFFVKTAGLLAEKGGIRCVTIQQAGGL